jgi:hypothetical protein
MIDISWQLHGCVIESENLERSYFKFDIEVARKGNTGQQTCGKIRVV